MTKVLMFGWEFPPNSSGGLGTACKGLTKWLRKKGIEILFVVPRGDPAIEKNFELIPVTNTFKLLEVNSTIMPYMTSDGYAQKMWWEKEKKGLYGATLFEDSTIKPYMTSDGYLRRVWWEKEKKGLYGATLFEEVQRYAELAKIIAQKYDFDVIHCHDWMTYLAGINAKRISGKPLVVHVHSTEFDRTGGNSVNQYVYGIEKLGMQEADIVLPVSNFTKNIIQQKYGISPAKIRVVHNGVELIESVPLENHPIKQGDKIVLFLGRITLQKGPEYFIEAAKKALQKKPNIKFIMAGSGDMEYRMVEKAAELGIGNKVLFAGFISGKDLDRAYRMADVYVMPSVSEPFGITPLEAMRNKTPVIISKQSGVSEILRNCLKVDFWDIDEMANKILSVLEYKPLHEEISTNAFTEVKKISWEQPADKCVEIYYEVLKTAG